MNMHDKMAKELFDNKSLKALSYLIEHGRELEFEYDKKICFLSKDNSSGFVSIWVEKKEQYFDSMEQLIEKAEINNVSFEEIWKEGGMTKAVGEKVVQARAQKAFDRSGTVLACTRYGNVMCSRGSVIPLFIEQIKAQHPITITDPNMTRFLMNLDEAVNLVAFAFEHAEPGDLFIQKADASTIGDLADGVMKVFGETEKKLIGTRHGEKLFETLMTREERLRSTDMGQYFRIAPDERTLNYDKFYVEGQVTTMADEAYTSHNTNRLDVDGVVEKIMTIDYVKEELEGRPHIVEA